MRIQYIIITITVFLLQSCFEEKSKDILPEEFSLGGFTDASLKISEAGEEVATARFVSGKAFANDVTFNYTVTVEEDIPFSSEGVDYTILNEGSFILPAGEHEVKVNLLQAVDNEIGLPKRKVKVVLNDSPDINFALLEGAEATGLYRDIEIDLLDDDEVIFTHTGFEEVATVTGNYTTTGTTDLPNNDGQPTVDFEGNDKEIGFDLSYLQPSDDDDELPDPHSTKMGVSTDNPFKGEQSYVLSNTKKFYVELAFDEIEIPTDAISSTLSMQIFFADTSWESSDRFIVFWRQGGKNGSPLIDLRGNSKGDDEDKILLEGEDIRGQWKQIDFDIPEEKRGKGNLVIHYRCNSGSEQLYIDEITTRVVVQ